MLYNVTITMKEGTKIVLKQVSVQMSDGIYIAHSGTRRVVCHLKDIFLIDEEAVAHQDLREKIIAIGSSQGAINAIKELRMLTGMALKEARDQVYTWMGLN